MSYHPHMNQVLLPYGVSQTPITDSVIRSYAFPLILSCQQERLLHHVMDLGHEIRERVVAQREDNRRLCREAKLHDEVPVYLGLTQQRKDIATWLKVEPRFKLIHSQVAQNQCERIDDADKAWLKKRKAGNLLARPAHSRERKDFRSITYPQYGNGVRLSRGKVWFSKLGSFRLHDYRKIEGIKKTVSIVWKQGRFWAVFTAQVPVAQWFTPTEEWVSKPTVAGDPGLNKLLALSDGLVMDTPRRMKDAFAAVKHLQRSVSRKFEARKRAWEAAKKINPQVGPLRDFPRSARLVAEIRRLAKAHTKVERCRDYDQAKIAARLEKQYSVIAIEDHGVTFMLRNRKLARSAADRSIHKLKLRIDSTLGPARVLKVSTQDQEGNGNSQTCTCGITVRKTLKDRVHACTACGRTGDRDVVAADRVHLRAFGHITRVLGQSVRKRGEAEFSLAKPPAGESMPIDFRSLIEAPTSPACWAKANTSGGEPTEADKNSLVLASQSL